MANQPPTVPGITQQAADPLAALRDIQEPGIIAAWPPAPGWWALAALLAIGLMIGTVWLYRKWSANRYRREALGQLVRYHSAWQDSQDDAVFLLNVQQLLKRVALTRFNRDQVAALTGEAWLQFLDQSSMSHAFSIGAAEALIDGNYRADISIDVPAIEMLAREWIKTHDSAYLTKAGADHIDRGNPAVSAGATAGAAT